MENSVSIPGRSLRPQCTDSRGSVLWVSLPDEHLRTVRGLTALILLCILIMALKQDNSLYLLTSYQICIMPTFEFSFHLYSLFWWCQSEAVKKIPSSTPARDTKPGKPSKPNPLPAVGTLLNKGEAIGSIFLLF